MLPIRCRILTFPRSERSTIRRFMSRTLYDQAGYALKWNYVGVAVKSFSSLAVGIVLARLLGPKPFGLVAVAALIIGFGNLLADFGFGAAIVQREDVTEEDLRFVFLFQMLSGVALGGACFLGAGLIARLFRNSEVAPVIRALSLVFPLQAFGQTAINLLRRKLAFRALQAAQVSGHLTYLVAGVALALLGYGVWALVAAQLVQVALTSIIAFALAPHSLKVSFRINRPIVQFGTKVLGSNIANWAIGNLDNAFVGRVFGAVPLGLYSRAFQLTSAPTSAIMPGLQSVLFAASSRAQGRVDALRRAYLASFSVVAVVTVPLFAAVAAIPTTVILALYGPKWVGSVPMLVPLALAMPLFALLCVAGPLLWGIGKVGRELRVQLVTAMLAVVVFSAACRFSVVLLAWGVLGVYAFRLALLTRELTHHLRVAWMEMVAAVRGGIALGLLAAPLAWVCNRLCTHTPLPKVFTLAVAMLAVLAEAGLCLAAAPRAVLGPHAEMILTQVRSVAPNWIRKAFAAPRPEQEKEGQVV